MISLRRIKSFCIIVGFIFVLAACGTTLNLDLVLEQNQNPITSASPSTATPEEVVEFALVSIFDGDLDGLSSVICSRDSSVVDEFEAEGIMEMMELVEVDLSEADFELIDIDDSTAIVRMSGLVTMSALGEEQTMSADELLGGETEVTLIREDDQWKFCDEGALGTSGG